MQYAAGEVNGVNIYYNTNEIRYILLCSTVSRLSARLLQYNRPTKRKAPSPRYNNNNKRTQAQLYVILILLTFVCLFWFSMACCILLVWLRSLCKSKCGASVCVCVRCAYTRPTFDRPIRASFIAVSHAFGFTVTLFLSHSLSSVGPLLYGLRGEHLILRFLAHVL